MQQEIIRIGSLKIQELKEYAFQEGYEVEENAKKEEIFAGIIVQMMEKEKEKKAREEEGDERERDEQEREDPERDEKKLEGRKERKIQEEEEEEEVLFRESGEIPTEIKKLIGPSVFNHQVDDVEKKEILRLFKAPEDINLRPPIMQGQFEHYLTNSERLKDKDLMMIQSSVAQILRPLFYLLKDQEGMKTEDELAARASLLLTLNSLNVITKIRKQNVLRKMSPGVSENLFNQNERLFNEEDIHNLNQQAIQRRNISSLRQVFTSGQSQQNPSRGRGLYGARGGFQPNFKNFNDRGGFNKNYNNRFNNKLNYSRFNNISNNNNNNNNINNNNNNNKV